MKRLYECLAVLSKNDVIQTMTARGIGESKEEVMGKFLSNVQTAFPQHSILKIFVEKVSMNDILYILDNIDISEAHANFIKQALIVKGY